MAGISSFFCTLQITQNTNQVDSWRRLSLECIVTLAETGNVIVFLGPLFKVLF